MPIDRDLLSKDQLKGMADIWARTPLAKRGACRNEDCDHHGTLEPDGQCLWCAGRKRRIASAETPKGQTDTVKGTDRP